MLKTIEQFHNYLEEILTINSLLSSLHTKLPVSLPKESFNASNLSSFKLLEDYADFLTDDKHVHFQISKYLYEYLEDEGIVGPVKHFGSYLDAILASFLESLGYVELQYHKHIPVIVLGSSQISSPTELGCLNWHH